jgi:hypothetical protein
MGDEQERDSLILAMCEYRLQLAGDGDGYVFMQQDMLMETRASNVCSHEPRSLDEE